MVLFPYSTLRSSFSNSLIDAGYDVIFNPLVRPNYLRTALLHKEIICLEGHGTQHEMKMTSYTTAEVTISDADPLMQSESDNVVLLKNYDLSNVDLMVLLTCDAASNRDGTGTNLCLTAYEQGAECVLGWAESVYFDDSELWMERFQQKLCEGWTVENAVRYANSFLYYSYLPMCNTCEYQKRYNEGFIECECEVRSAEDFSVYICSTVKSTRIYGNSELVITLENINDVNSEDNDYYDLRNAGYTTQENIYSNKEYIFGVICELFQDADIHISHYEHRISYTSDDGDDYVWDFVYMPFPSAPGQLYGYTVIVEDNVIIGIRDNMNTNS